MALWFILALMTVAAAFAVLWPLARCAQKPSGSDVMVYRDQLEEIERDRALGRIGKTEAEAARVEVSRRLIAAADAQGSPGESPPQAALWRRRVVAIAALSLLPFGAVAFYLALGSPFLPGAPLSARLNLPPEQRSTEALVAQVESHLERNPQDGRGWEVLAPVYLRLGRYEDAVQARRKALQLLGPSAARQSDLAEALTLAANGVVTAEAKQIFERAAAADARDPKAQFFLGLAAEQDGNGGEAARRWRELLARAPADAAYRELVQSALARVDPNAKPAGPTSEDIVAAEALTPEQRGDMVRGMVARLAERLKNDGGDVEGWLRLVRAYMVLGERDKARAAAADARRAIGADAAKRRKLDELVKGLGLEG